MKYRAVVKDQGVVMVIFEHDIFMELCQMVADELLLLHDGKERSDAWTATVEFSGN
jgi:hypothetical protein